MQLEHVEIHYVTKKSYKSILQDNPYIDKLFTFEENISELFEILLNENFDVVIDLHKNLRSKALKRKLGTKSYSYKKVNLQKYLAVNFKLIKLLPQKHIVERYFDTVAQLGVHSDGKGLDFFINEKNKLDVATLFFNRENVRFVALVIGGSYYTKRIPLDKLKEICAALKMPVILLGDQNDNLVAVKLKNEFPQLINACGIYSITQSASIIEQAEWVISSDTGLMHVAAAFSKKIISVWGNTIPEFGMGPYLPNPSNLILETKGLACRPCSKLGSNQCPLKHFNCMKAVDYSFLYSLE
jgi:ADP-heptose:LPS heptosyltransferase